MSDRPHLEIGVRDGPPEHQFTSIVAIWHREDGAIVVADSGPREIRIFDGSGRLRATAGAEGDGPGEFAALAFVTPYRGDSIAAWDPRLRRLTVFDGEGRLGRTATIPFPMADPAEVVPGTGYAPPRLLGVFEDGGLLVVPPAVYPVVDGGFVEREDAFWRYSPDGEPVRTLGSFPVPERWTPSSDQWAAVGPGGALPLQPFMRNLVVATHGHRTYVGASGQYEVEVLASDGSVEQLIRSSHLDLTLTEAHREAYREKQRLRASGGSRQAFEQILGEVPFPEALPPYSRFVVDPEEYLWVRDSQPLGEPDSHTWSVFDPEGGRVSEVTMPPGLQVHMVGTDSVLGVWRDDLAGPYVRLYALSTVSVPHPPTTADPRAGS